MLLFLLLSQIKSVRRNERPPQTVLRACVCVVLLRAHVRPCGLRSSRPALARRGRDNVALTSQGQFFPRPPRRPRAHACFTTWSRCVLSVTMGGGYKSAPATATDASLTDPSGARSLIRVNVPSTTPLNLGGGACWGQASLRGDTCHSTHAANMEKPGCRVREGREGRYSGVVHLPVASTRAPCELGV